MLSAVVIGNPAAIGEMVKCVTSVATDEVSIVSAIDNISAGITYLQNHAEPDIIFCSPGLTTGLSFEILDHTNRYVPVVFMADDTHFLKAALEYNCIAYLLNPVKPHAVERALMKYRMLNDYFVAAHLKQNTTGAHNRHERMRMIVKSGTEHISLPLTEVVLVHTRYRCVYVIDPQGVEYTTDKTLTEIESVLDKEKFFRVNRHCIVNINYVRGFKSFERVKLLVELTVPGLKQSVIVSQELAHDFRDWMYNA